MKVLHWFKKSGGQNTEREESATTGTKNFGGRIKRSLSGKIGPGSKLSVAAASAGAKSEKHGEEDVIQEDGDSSDDDGCTSVCSLDSVDSFSFVHPNDYVQRKTKSLSGSHSQEQQQQHLQQTQNGVGGGEGLLCTKYRLLPSDSSPPQLKKKVHNFSAVTGPVLPSGPLLPPETTDDKEQSPGLLLPAVVPKERVGQLLKPCLLDLRTSPEASPANGLDKIGNEVERPPSSKRQGEQTEKKTEEAAAAAGPNQNGAAVKSLERLNPFLDGEEKDKQARPLTESSPGPKATVQQPPGTSSLSPELSRLDDVAASLAKDEEDLQRKKAQLNLVGVRIGSYLNLKAIVY